MVTARPAFETHPAPVQEALDTCEPPAVPNADQPVEADQLVEADLLVEDVSIDGMCGVY